MDRRVGWAAVRVLRAVAHGSRYGFDIIDATGLPSGTVYPALSRHEADGYVRSSWEDPVKAHRDQHPPRRYYRITAHGKRALEQALAELGIEPTSALRPARVKAT
jgi:PadR family transcriptional regulator PadR